MGKVIWSTISPVSIPESISCRVTPASDSLFNTSGGYILIDKYENQIGKVTSGTLSPYLEKAIGLGYVKSDFSSPLTEIGVVIRGKVWTAKIVKTPFI